MPTAILLISDQTLHNVLFIKQMGPFEKFVFLTTDKMEKEGRSDWIINAARLHPDQVSRLKIDPENANESLRILKSAVWSENTPLVVNLTGGSKMMALAAYAFFTEKPDCQILYMPIDAHSPHLLELFPGSDKIQMSATVSLEEYLSAYGAVIQSQNAAWSGKSNQAVEVMNAVLGKGDPAILSLTSHGNQTHLNAEDRKFYSGEWLEIWLAWAIHHYWGIPQADIRVEVKLNRIGVAQNASFEYDVIFIRNNRLYAGECKFFNGNSFNLRKINKELFKFASLNAQLGLYAKPFFAIANQINNEKQAQALNDQCQILRLKPPAQIDILSDPDKFTEFLNSI